MQKQVKYRAQISVPMGKEDEVVVLEVDPFDKEAYDTPLEAVVALRESTFLRLQNERSIVASVEGDLSLIDEWIARGDRASRWSVIGLLERLNCQLKDQLKAVGETRDQIEAVSNFSKGG